MIKVVMAVMMVVVVGICAPGCSLLQGDDAAELRSAILTYVAQKGQEAALEYVDQMVEDGKLDAAQGEQIKAAIPLGVDAVKKALEEALAKEGE